MLEAQVFNQEAKIRVESIELLELLVLSIGLKLQLASLYFFGSDLLLELLDTVIEDKFKLFKLLCLPLKIINLCLSIAYRRILLSYLLIEQLDVILMILQYPLLLIYGATLIHDVTLKALLLLINILHLVLDQLQLCL